MGKDKEPSFQDQVNAQMKANVEEKEMVEAPDYTQLLRNRDLVQIAIIEGRFERYFLKLIYDDDGHPHLNPEYSPAFEPLYPLFSHRLPLAKLTPEQLRRWRGRLHSIVQQCYALTNDRREQLIIQSMEEYLVTIMEGQTTDGFFLRALTTNEKVLRLTTPQGEKQKPWYQFW